MSRDRANLRTAMWADSDWRALTHDAQWLYEHLLTSAGLSACGVHDWRPVRLAKMAAGLTPSLIRDWAGELTREYFIVIDEETEEVVVRSFFRHDGILAQPNPMKGAARVFGSIASETIRGVISHELRRLREDFPSGVGRSNVWELVPELDAVMRTPPIDAKELVAGGSPDPSGNPSENPSKGSENPSDTSTSTSTPTEASIDASPAPRKRAATARGTRIPDPFNVTGAMREWAAHEVPGLDVDRVTRSFVDYWRAKSGKDATKNDWVATWRNWLRREYGSGPSGGAFAPGAGPSAPRRPTNEESNLLRFEQRYGGGNGRAGDARALGQGIGD